MDENYDSINIENNSINGFPVGYFYSKENVFIDGEKYGQIIFVFCSNIFLKNLDVYSLSFIGSRAIYANTVMINSRGKGIIMYKTRDAHIEHLYASLCEDYAVHIDKSENISILNSNLTYIGGTGILIDNATKVSVKNTFFEFVTVAFNITHGESIDIRNNTICLWRSPKKPRILLYGSRNITFDNNTVDDSQRGEILIADTSVLFFTNNKLIGIALNIDCSREYAENIFFENTTINGEKVGYFLGLDTTVISDATYGQIIIMNSHDLQIENIKTYGILIYNSSKVILRNVISNYTIYGSYVGLSHSINFDNCTFYSNRINAFIYKSSDVLFMNCTLNRTLFWQNFVVVDSDKIFLSGNNIGNGFTDGVYLYNATHIEIDSNIIFNNMGNSICVIASKHIEIIKNIIHKNKAGILVNNSSEVFISQNDIVGGSILLRDIENISSIRIEDNKINGRPMILYYNASNLIIEKIDAGQILLLSCANVTIKSANSGSLEIYEGKNIKLSNISVYNSDIGIDITGSDSVVIENIDINNNTVTGLSIFSSRNVTINEINISNISVNGMHIYYSFAVDIKSANISNVDEVGLLLNASENALISDIKINNCTQSITIERTINFSAESTFIDRCSDAIIAKKSLGIQMKDVSLHNVDNSGIYIYKGAIISIHGFLLSESIKGMNIESSFFISIKNSQVYRTYVGIHLVESRYVNITNNVLEKNDYGLIIESSSRIIIANNRILSNKKNIVIKSSHDVKIIDNDFGDYGIGIYLIYVVNLCVIVFWAIYLIDIKKKRIGR